MSLARFVCHACYQMKVSCNLSFPVLPFRGGGWQGFAALPQPALLQGLSGPRPPADHQRQPLPPHCSLWVLLFLSLWPLSVFNPFFLSHYVSYCPFLCFSLFLIDRCVDFSLLSLPPALFPSVLFFPSCPWDVALVFFHHMHSFSPSITTVYCSFFSLSRPAAELSAWGFHGNHPLVSRLALPWRPTPFSTR